MATGIDSQQYATGFTLRSARDTPSDFNASIDTDRFLAGASSRDPPDWFGRSAYPPRALILIRDGLLILTHPRANQPPVRIPLGELAVVELGHFLLQGWVKFIAAGAECPVRYNTTNQRVVDRFLERLRTAWLAPVLPVDPCPEVNVDDMKFQNTLRLEIQPDERLCAFWFSPPGSERKHWWRRYAQRHPGDLLALTTKRLLWITDRHRGRYARYGTITSSTPISHVLGVFVEQERNENQLRVDLDTGHIWRVLLPIERREEARQFTRDVGQTINRKSSPAHPCAEGQT